jgi:hypothetical protein
MKARLYRLLISAVLLAAAIAWGLCATLSPRSVPAAAGTMALFVGLCRGGEKPGLRILSEAFTVIPAGVLFTPVIYLLYFVATIGAAPVFMALTALILALVDWSWPASRRKARVESGDAWNQISGR